MRILVCGGRNFSHRIECFAALERLHEKVGITTIIHGSASGADELAGDWAEGEGIPIERFPADWKAHGRAAGPLRNQRMIDEGKPDGVVAFPGGRGTADMIKRAQEAGLKVWRPMGGAHA